MKKWTLVFLLLTACKGGGGGAAPAAVENPVPNPEPPPVVVPKCAPQMTVVPQFVSVTAQNYMNIGLYITTINNEIWLKNFTSNHYFKVSLANEIGGANEGLIYNNSQCTELIGEVFNYPLRLSQDTYVFNFEDVTYEYSTNTDFDFFGTIPGPYYFKTENGPCTPCQGPVENVRQVVPSGFNL